MLFNSLSYAIFLPIVFCLYWIFPQKWRWCLILVSSCYFYMSWNPKYIFLILFATIVSWVAALGIEKAHENQKVQKGILSFAIMLLIVLLVVFKYFDFFSETIVEVLNKFSLNLHPITLKLTVPVGISFYTFQTIAYVVDVYKGKCVAEKHWGGYAAFVTFFPQLVAGPIERTADLLPQIKEYKKFDYNTATYGLKLMGWGFFKKIVVADNLATIVDKVYDNPQNYTGFALVIATVFFAIQIYCDFSGYSDIAVGTARLFQIRLTKNFDSPYFSKSIKEFWNRWHISLSQWFGDYVYIPMGGNKCSKVKHSFNLLITFLVSGLWHGANITYVIWGAIHGILRVLENLFFPKKKQDSKRGVLAITVVFALCCFAWVFFRSANIQDAIYILKNTFNGCMNISSYVHTGFVALDISSWKMIVLAISLGILIGFDYISLKKDVIEMISSKPVIVRWSVYVFGILYIIFFRAVNQTPAFIYFQF